MMHLSCDHFIVVGLNIFHAFITDASINQVALYETHPLFKKTNYYL